jgi:hypothetical protein
MAASSEAEEPLAARTFVAAVAVAAPVILYQGRDQWFYFDDWFFLEPAGSLAPGDLVEPYWGHLCLLPRLLHSALFSLFGINSYLPYQLLVVAAHLAVALLLWTVARRALVPGWVATAIAAFLLFFGPGRDNIVWAFQVSLTGAIALGLGQLVLADHDGPVGRRDAVAATLGLLAVATANSGVVVVMGTVVAVMLRRGLRPALVQAAPAGTAFGLWWLLVSRHEPTPVDFTASGPGELVEYGWGLVRDLAAVAGPGPTGWVWLALTAFGGFVAVAGVRSQPRWAASVGLLVSAAAFLVLVSFQRGGTLDASFGVDPAPGRYTYVLVALTLPVVAVGCGRLVARRRALVAVPVVLVAACLPANIAALAEPKGAYMLGDELSALTTADVASDFDELPRDRPASLTLLRDLGWVADADAAGRIPAPPSIDATERSAAFAWIAFSPAVASATTCPAVDDPDAAALGPGDRLQVRAATGTAEVTVTRLDDDLSATFTTDPTGALDLAVLAGPFTARVGTAGAGATQVGVCR